MNKPISQFITKRGCVIQGVMKDNSEISYIYCPEHRELEYVYSFHREIDLSKPMHPKERTLINRLKSEFKEKCE